MKTNRVWVERIDLILVENAPAVEIVFREVSSNEPIRFMTAIKNAFQIHRMNELLRKMESGIPIHFKSYGQYRCLLGNVEEAVRAKMEYTLTSPDTEKRRLSDYNITEPSKTPLVHQFLRKIRIA